MSKDFSLSFFFLFSLTLIFLCLSSFFAFALHFSLPLHEPNNKNKGLDLRHQSPPSPSVTYLVGIITQRRKISSIVPQQRKSVIMDMADDKVLSIVFLSMPSWTWLMAIFLIPLPCRAEIPFAFFLFWVLVWFNPRLKSVTSMFESSFF